MRLSGRHNANKKATFQIAGKYVKADPPLRKIIYLIKRAAGSGLES